MKEVLLVTFFGASLTPALALARKVEDWTYDRLLKEADLVVIAYAQSFAPSKQEWPEKVFEKNRFEAVETIFHAKSVLKGETPPRIRLIHFEYAEHATPYNDGPGLVSFFAKPVSIDVTQRRKGEVRIRELKQKGQSLTSKPEYLLFLKKRKDGAYEAVSGQMDPSFSVRALFELRILR